MLLSRLFLGLNRACDLQSVSLGTVLIDVVGKLVFGSYLICIDLLYHVDERLNVINCALGYDESLVYRRRDDIDIAQMSGNPVHGLGIHCHNGALGLLLVRQYEVGDTVILGIDILDLKILGLSHIFARSSVMTASAKP